MFGFFSGVRALAVRSRSVFVIFCAAWGLLLAIGGSALGVPAQQSTSSFDHLATGYPLVGKHEIISCETCHIDGVFKGLPVNCAGCHDGLMAFGQPPTHIPTNERCDACHSPNSFTVVATMDHSVTSLACVQCHNGITAGGKAPRHLPTTNTCDSCHAVAAWKPVQVFDHHEALGTCVGCHDGVGAQGKSRRHINSTDICDACHNTVDFANVRRVDHDEVLGSCNSAGCHSLPARHVLSTQQCDACHNTRRWDPVQILDHNELLGSCADAGCHMQPPLHAATTMRCEACHGVLAWVPLRGPVDHHEVIDGRCMDCHLGAPRAIVGIVATSQPLTHIPTGDQSCDLCHNTNSWIPAIFTHAGVSDNCVLCHTTGINATAKSPTHILSTNLCETCHNTLAWTPVVTVDHSQVLGTCASAGCHRIATGKGPNHVTTSSECDTCHATVAWTPAGIDHSGFASNCFSCHDGVTASGKTPTHINSSNFCESCHDVFPARWRPVLASRVDHTQVIGSCVSCHNGTTATGKGPLHINTTTLCDACHQPGPVPWSPLPASAVDHGQVLGVCSSCHNGVTAQGKSASHVQTNDECDVCHNTNAWVPASVTPDHATFVANCISCHNGITASGKGGAHMPTSDLCDACHDKFPATWKPVLANRVDHTQVIGSCVTCHNGSTASGKLAAHMPTSDQCDSCHLEGPNPWTPVPAARVDHSQVIGTCVSCHNGVTATGKSAVHILSTDVCNACHAVGPTPWAPLAPSQVDHLNVIGRCDSCHRLPGNHCNTGVLGTDCEACHIPPIGGSPSPWINTLQGCGATAPAPVPAPGPAPGPGGGGLPTAVIAQPAPPATSFNVNTSVTFSGAGSSDPSGLPLSYSWSFGDGGSASGQNVQHTYTVANAAYTVVLTVDNGNGGIDTATVTLCIRSFGMGGMGGGVTCP